MANTAPSLTDFPLQKVTQSELRQLGQILWSWPICKDCENGKGCLEQGCASQRLNRLSRFFDRYRALTASYESDCEHPAITKHEDLFHIIKDLKSNPDMTRAELAETHFPNRLGRRPPPLNEQERAIDLAVRIMAMVSCSAQQRSPDLLEQGAYQAGWRNDITFSQFITDIFPMTDHPGLSENDESTPLDQRTVLTAKKLKKYAGLDFRPTDNLRNHLRLDRRRNVVEIFHYTAFLKEQLRLTKEGPKNLSVSDSLRM
jgi:hypothetical protein